MSKNFVVRIVLKGFSSIEEAEEHVANNFPLDGEREELVEIAEVELSEEGHGDQVLRDLR